VGILRLRYIKNHNMVLLINGFRDLGLRMRVFGARWWWLSLGKNLVGRLMRCGLDMDVGCGSLIMCYGICFEIILILSGSGKEIRF